MVYNTYYSILLLGICIGGFHLQRKREYTSAGTCMMGMLLGASILMQFVPARNYSIVVQIIIALMIGALLAEALPSKRTKPPKI